MPYVAGPLSTTCRVPIALFGLCLFVAIFTSTIDASAATVRAAKWLYDAYEPV